MTAARDHIDGGRRVPAGYVTARKVRSENDVWRRDTSRALNYVIALIQGETP